jgi:hypothetical protein
MVVVLSRDNDDDVVPSRDPLMPLSCDRKTTSTVGNKFINWQILNGSSPENPIKTPFVDDFTLWILDQVTDLGRSSKY